MLGDGIVESSNSGRCKGIARSGRRVSMPLAKPVAAGAAA